METLLINKLNHNFDKGEVYWLYFWIWL